MSSAWDAIVVGLGAMGSATAATLARRGRRVLGIDRFHPPHDRGSSHGQTRVIREAYWEDPFYIPLVRRASGLWRELEARRDASLLVETGALLVGKPDGPLISGTRRSIATWDLDIETLEPVEVRRRFPAFGLADDEIALWERRAGTLFPERCVEALLAEAREHGAELRFGESVVAWQAGAAGVEVETGLGSASAGSLVIAAGAWVGELVPDLGVEVERQVLHWFPAPEARSFATPGAPIYLFEEADLTWYGFPDFGDGLKIARHHGGETTTADGVRRDIDERDLEPLRAHARRRLGVDASSPSRSTVCLYTNTADGHFVLDRHPAHENVILASPCSGHGFKFAPALGEILADLCDGRDAGPALFRAGRPALSAATPEGN